jgi:thiol-disulfide isomerase/thioredoxin
MSQDLNRVSVINFWAPWAEPSIQMNQIVEELVKKHPSIQFLQVFHTEI